MRPRHALLFLALTCGAVAQTPATAKPFEIGLIPPASERRDGIAVGHGGGHAGDRGGGDDTSGGGSGARHHSNAVQSYGLSSKWTIFVVSLVVGFNTQQSAYTLPLLALVYGAQAKSAPTASSSPTKTYNEKDGDGGGDGDGYGNRGSSSRSSSGGKSGGSYRTSGSIRSLNFRSAITIIFTGLITMTLCHRTSTRWTIFLLGIQSLSFAVGEPILITRNSENAEIADDGGSDPWGLLSSFDRRSSVNFPNNSPENIQKRYVGLVEFESDESEFDELASGQYPREKRYNPEIDGRIQNHHPREAPLTTTLTTTKTLIQATHTTLVTIFREVRAVDKQSENPNTGYHTVSEPGDQLLLDPWTSPSIMYQASSAYYAQGGLPSIPSGAAGFPGDPFIVLHTKSEPCDIPGATGVYSTLPSFWMPGVCSTTTKAKRTAEPTITKAPAVNSNHVSSRYPEEAARMAQ